MGKASALVSALLPLGLGLIVMATTACETLDRALIPSGPETTLMVGWERHFTLDWTVEPDRGDLRQLRGYVANQHGEYAEDVRLLAQALDASGAVVGRRIVWVPGGVPGFGRTAFVIPRLPSADHYQVTVWTYTFHQSDGGAQF